MSIIPKCVDGLKQISPRCNNLLTHEKIYFANAHKNNNLFSKFDIFQFRIFSMSLGIRKCCLLVL